MVRPSGVGCTPMVWGRADLHMHTTASDGWPTPAQLVDHAAFKAALNVIAITDHDTIEGALRAADHATKRRRLHVIVGEEVKSRRVHGVGWLAAELDFDAIEVENATPGFYVFNQLAHRLNLGLGAAELGCSDAHIVDAVGRAFTEFPGTTSEALRKAIENGETRARRRRYRAVGLMRYAAWGFNHQRYVPA